MLARGQWLGELCCERVVIAETVGPYCKKQYCGHWSVTSVSRHFSGGIYYRFHRIALTAQVGGVLGGGDAVGLRRASRDLSIGPLRRAFCGLRKFRVRHTQGETHARGPGATRLGSL